MTKKANLLFWVCILSTLAAVGVHTYLTQHHYNFKYGHNLEASVCDVSETVNCNSTTASQYSEIMGVAVSIPGALINLLLFFLLLAWRFSLVGEKTREGLGGTIRLISLGIFGVSLVMGFISYALLHTICPFCTAAYAISLITFASAWSVTGGASLFSPSQLKVYGIGAVTVLICSFLAHKNYMKEYGGNQQLEMLTLQVNEWKQIESKPFETASPLVMNASKGAKMKIVEFADFLCGHCAHAFPIIHTFAKSHPDVEFSFQAFPLDGACNPAIEYAEGTRCLLARISHCAGQQKEPWETQKWIFENQPKLLSKDQVMTEIKSKISELDLNEGELMSCVEAEETQEIIRSQAQKGIEAGVKGTPSIYINGKKVPGRLSIQIFNRIYQDINKD